MSVPPLVTPYLQVYPDLLAVRGVSREWRSAADEAVTKLALPRSFCSRFCDGSCSVTDLLPYLSRLRGLRDVDVSRCASAFRLRLALELREALSPWWPPACAPVVSGRPICWEDRAALGTLRPRPVRLRTGLLDTWVVSHPSAEAWVATFEQVRHILHAKNVKYSVKFVCALCRAWWSCACVTTAFPATSKPCPRCWRVAPAV